MTQSPKRHSFESSDENKLMNYSSLMTQFLMNFLVFPLWFTDKDARVSLEGGEWILDESHARPFTEKRAENVAM